MRNPNGYGSVINLGKKRRKPYAVRITTGYDDNGKQLYKYIGYYANRKEALYQLSLYNMNPYDVDLKKLTLNDVYNRYYDTQKSKVAESRLISYRAFYKNLKPLLHLNISDIKTVHLQTLMDSLTENLSTGTLRVLKFFISSLFKYAMKMDIINKDYSQFIVLPKHKEKIDRKIFTEEEIALLWANLEELEYADVILILIYTGMRINELLKLKKENVDIENCIIKSGSKTEAGKNRIIPIHPKIFPLILKRMDNKTEYLIPNKTETNYYIYNNFRKGEFIEIMAKLGMKHTVHDTRHTFATMMREVSHDNAAITGIIGHTNIRMTDKYTHTSIEKMRKEIEKIN